MTLPEPQFWIQVATTGVTIVAAVIGAALWIQSRLHRVDERLRDLQVQVGIIEHQNRALLKAFPPVISSLMAGKVMTPEQGTKLIAGALDAASITDLLGKVRPSANPLSEEDVHRLRSYVDRLKRGEWLNSYESEDFYRLADTLTHEYPGYEGSWLLLLIGGIVLGLVIAGAGPKK